MAVPNEPKPDLPTSTHHDGLEYASAVESRNESPKTEGCARLRTLAEAELLDGRYRTTARGLSNRQVQMMALGGTIGTGLFVASGQALYTAGPASLLIAYILVSIVVFCIVTAVAEIAAFLPVHGGTMSYHGSRYVSRSLGFAMGYLYWYSLGILVPYELTAAALLIGYWPNDINVGVWITIMLVVVVGLNFLPVRFYGESEFWFSLIKVITLAGLLFLSFILFWGGGPNHQRLGFHYWMDPGAFNPFIFDGPAGRATGFFQSIVYSAPAFIFAPELIVITSGEMQSPRRTLPRAVRRFVFRLIFFYIFCVLAIGVICPSKDSLLVHGGADAASSPFVIAIEHASIPVLGSIINAAILTSAWSSANSYLYMSSRSLYSLAVAGSAPRFLKSCNRWGVPYAAVSISALFSSLAYISLSRASSTVYDWLIAFTNTSGFISWICCTIIFFRFRTACRVQGVEVPYKSRLQPYGAYIGLAGSIFFALINGFTVFIPSKWSVSTFFTSYIGIPAFLFLYLAHRAVFWSDPWAWNPRDIDLQTGLQEIIDAERPVKRLRGWAKVLAFLIE